MHTLNSYLSIFLFSIVPFFCTAEVELFKVFSDAMKKEINNTVVLPSAYSTSEKEYPVLYLLHGAGGDHRNWISSVPEIQAYADQYQLIIICPDGGRTSWYLDSPIDPSSQYETYFTKELIPAFDKKYRTIDNPKARAITGLSMGGHGALYLAFRHQDIWGAAGSMSGGVDLCPFPGNWDISLRLGEYQSNIKRWEAHSVVNMTHLVEGSKLKLILDCGVDDFFYQVNKHLHADLVKKDIPHEFIIRPGGHTWAYWANAIQYQMLFFGEVLIPSHAIETQEK